MLPISVLVVTKNAQPQIEACLSALSGFSQVIVVDSYSDDGTAALAQGLGAEVINYQWNGAYPKKRQWCLETLHIKNDWVFFVDADEVVTAALIDEVKRIDWERTGAAGYFVRGQYVWNDLKLRYGLCNHKIALFNRHKMHFPVIDDLDCPGMGEIEGHYQPVLKKQNSGKIKRLRAPLWHYANHSRAAWAERHRRYAAWERCMNKKDAWPADPVAWRQFLKTLLRYNPLKPEMAFVHSYIIKGGFLDGYAGLDFALSRWRYYCFILRWRA